MRFGCLLCQFLALLTREEFELAAALKPWHCFF